MFFPFRYEGYAVYDIRFLIPSFSVLEERLYVEATRRIPTVFLVGESWGNELTEATVWIDERHHDWTYARIREGIRSDTRYINSLQKKIRQDLRRFEQSVNRTISLEADFREICTVLEDCATAIGWVASNWLNPNEQIRLAITRLLGADQVDEMFEILLLPEISSYMVRSYAALLEVAEGKQDTKTFLRQWGPSYASGDTAKIKSPKEVLKLIDQIAPEHCRLIQFEELREARLAKKQKVRSQLLQESERKDGRLTAELISAQLALAQSIVWEEEVRHVLQQLFYCAFRSWMQCNSGMLEALSQQVPWAAEGILAAHDSYFDHGEN